MLSNFFFQPPKKRKFLTKIKYSILKKIFLIKWFLICNIKYYFTIFFIRNKKKLHNIYIILLSKNRPTKFRRLLDSINILSKKKNRIKILVLLDKDEKMKKDYIIISNYFKKNLDIELFFKNFYPYPLGYNFLASKVKKNGLICVLSDDLIISLDKWDDYLDFIASKFSKKKAFSIWTRSNNHTEKYYTLSEHPIINSNWFKALGCMCDEKSAFITDLLICELGRISGNFIITKKMIYNHLRADENIKEKDETSIKLKKFRQSKDFDWYPEWIKNTNKRIQNANKIKNFKSF